MTDSSPSRYTFLDFNAPMSDRRASELIADLGVLDGAFVVDLGCGWAEFLLRLLAGNPSATGLGIDLDADLVARGRQEAERRGLADRARLEVGDATSWAGTAELLVSIGSSHAWGDTQAMLRALRTRLTPAGRAVIGEGIWSSPPTRRACEALGVGDDAFNDMAGLVRLAMACGFRVLSLCEASLDEWDSFESRYCVGRERWLLEHPDAPDHDEVCAEIDRHRQEWLDGYRGVLGFAYLILGSSG